ncbi:MAG: DUF421 domain-containing protein [Longimicrobiales bacterium]
MDWNWITTTASAALMSLLTAMGLYAALILYTRAMGLRSFSKMSSFDFAVTVAFGSLLASAVVSSDPPLLLAVVAMGSLYAIQWAVSALRTRIPLVRAAVDNQPVLLMWEGTIHEDTLRRTGVARSDLMAKLREANVLRLEQVRAVVLESTGDVSVLHESPDGAGLDEALLEGVRRER